MGYKERKRLFLQELEKTGDYYKSAINAGYSDYTARRWAKVWAEGTEAVPEKKTGMAEVLEFWADIMRDEERDIKERIKASELYAKAEGSIKAEDGTVMKVEVRVE